MNIRVLSGKTNNNKKYVVTYPKKHLNVTKTFKTKLECLNFASLQAEMIMVFHDDLLNYAKSINHPILGRSREFC